MLSQQITNELDHKLQRLLLNATSFLLIFILYASLLPYNITSMPIDSSFSGFLYALQISSVTAEPGKWIGHVIFNALVFFTASLYCGVSIDKKKWMWMSIGIFAFGIFIEYFQMFIGSRGTSLADIYANFAGITIGFILWVILGKFTIDALRYYFQFETLPLKFVRKLYLIFVIAIVLFPFDFYISPLQIEFAFATKGMPLFEIEEGGGIGSLSLIAAVGLCFPLGILYRLSSANNEKTIVRPWPILIKFGVMFLMLEILQFFEVSGQSSVLSFVCKYVGFLIGFGFGKYFDLKYFMELALRFRVLLYLGLFIFIWLALRIKGLAFTLPVSLTASLDVIADTSFLPFNYYIDVGSGEALLSFLLNLVIFIPLGAVYAVKKIAGENFEVSPFTRLMGLGLIIAFIFEVIVLLWGLKRPDVTNVLVSAFAMPVGYYFVVMCLNSISMKLPPDQVHET